MALVAVKQVTAYTPPVTVADVRLELLTDMLGTRAKHPEIMKTWLGLVEGVGEDEKQVAEGMEVDPDIDERELKRWTGFPKDEQGIYIWSVLVKGWLKELGNNYAKHMDVKAARSKINNFVFVHPRKIYLGLDEPDGVLERPLRAETMKGPRITLVKSDTVSAGTHIAFELHILGHPEITPQFIENLMTYGQFMGLGQWRTGGYGQCKLISFKIRA